MGAGGVSPEVFFWHVGAGAPASTHRACPRRRASLRVTLAPASPQLLIVDDAQFFAGFLQEKFQERGYSVATAKDALTALTFLGRSDAPLVVLLDLILPGVSGLQFLRELSKSPRAPRTRVVLLSAHHTVEAAAASHPLVVGRMQKPIDLGELVRMVVGAGKDLAARPAEA